MRVPGLVWAAILFGSGCIARPRVSPLQSEANPEPELAWVKLDRVMCTGRRRFETRAPQCDEYTVTIFEDGRVRWEGWRHVVTLGEVQRRVSDRDAQDLIDRTRRRLPGLGKLECTVAHAHYVGIAVAHQGSAKAVNYWGCGSRYRAAARAIDRVAKTHSLR